MGDKLFISHADLVIIGKNWLEKRQRCHVVLPEYRTWSGCIPDVIGFKNDRSYVIECKISRADFLSDKKKPHRQKAAQLGNLRYYLCASNTVCKEDIKNEWGLLFVVNSQIRIIKEATPIFTSDVKAEEWYILYSLARRIAANGLLDQAMEKF